MRNIIVEILFIAVFLSNCTETVTRSPSNTTTVVQDADTIFIVDITGKKWDVTHAKNKFGMDPSLYQYGIGPFAITPVLEPIMLCSDDSGYPDSNKDGLVLGVKMFGEIRAYPLDSLRCHEIVNDRFGTIYVAAAY